MTAGNFEERSKVCLDCKRCAGKPPILNQSNSPEEIAKRIVFQIENIVRQQNAGTLDLNALEYFEWKLLEIWRQAEIEHDRVFKAKLSAVFQAMLKQSK